MANIAKISTQERISVERIKEIINELIDAVNGPQSQSSTGADSTDLGGAEVIVDQAQVFIAKRTGAMDSPYQWKEQTNSSGTIIDLPNGRSSTGTSGDALWPDDSVFRFMCLAFPRSDHVRYAMCPILPKPTDTSKDGVWVWNATDQKVKWLAVPEAAGTYFLAHDSSGFIWLDGADCNGTV